MGSIMDWTVDPTIRTALGGMGTAISLLLFLAPVQVYRHIVAQKTTGVFSPVPYAMCFLSSSVWTLYSLPWITPNATMFLLSSSLGICFQTVYLSVYFLYSSNRKHLAVSLILEVIGVVSLGLVTNVMPQKIAHQALGYLGFAVTIFFYAGPLATIRLILRTKSSESLPIALIFVALCNSSTWCTYNTYRKDPFVAIPSLIGAILSASQIILYFRFKKPPKGKVADDFTSDEEKARESHTDIGLSEPEHLTELAEARTPLTARRPLPSPHLGRRFPPLHIDINNNSAETPRVPQVTDLGIVHNEAFAEAAQGIANTPRAILNALTPSNAAASLRELASAMTPRSLQQARRAFVEAMTPRSLVNLVRPTPRSARGGGFGRLPVDLPTPRSGHNPTRHSTFTQETPTPGQSSRRSTFTQEARSTPTQEAPMPGQSNRRSTLTQEAHSTPTQESPMLGQSNRRSTFTHEAHSPLIQESPGQSNIRSTFTQEAPTPRTSQSRFGRIIEKE